MQPIISILIANYNNGKYLMDAIESVRKQTYANWEIIIVDDGSTDNPAYLYNMLQTDSRIHVFMNTTNKGCGYTKDRCIREAKGDWCAFLDPDDKLREDALAIIAQHIEKYSQYGAFYSHMYICDAQMNVLMDATYPSNSVEFNTFIHYQRGIPLFCFKKGVYLSSSGIHPFLPQSVDIDLYYLITEQVLSYYIEQPLYYYRNNPISLTKNQSRAAATHLFVLLESLKRQGASGNEIIQELEGFWQWRVQPLQEELQRIKLSKTYRLSKQIQRIIHLICRK